MNIPLARRWEGFVEEQVRSGRFTSASDVIEESLRLLQARDEQLSELRAHIEAAIAEGGEYTAEDVTRILAEDAAELRRNGP